MRWASPEHHESVGSTNVEALAGPRPGRVVVADHQSAGQGRLGRTWESPPRTGMAISAVVPALPSATLGWLPLAAGLALALALEESRWPVSASLKWPNDVLVPLRDGGSAVLEADGVRWGKVAGVLCQVATNGSIVVGTGVNVDHTPDQLPVPTATSWRLARAQGTPAPLPAGAREELLTAYLSHLADAHGRLAEGEVAAVRGAYLQRCLTLGRPVRLHLPTGGTLEGTAVDLDADGALVLEDARGRTVHRAGDVEHVRHQ
ncbi:biotin--[acetyl-CoA-carboxylase] ligase [Ornithinimicrobium tianjinense]|uniref:biotin--[biotin carboxyl-carrier protein] ligase n=1 Tax=Ornithinimicrobium tianjinense TaxID=1195761 RepID=A0A917BIE7_9MICO|nr:biotin--[acetyl-CoA-carboxylase] ligase [Ornithinimicrobium tianjinense]